MNRLGSAAAISTLAFACIAACSNPRAVAPVESRTPLPFPTLGPPRADIADVTCDGLSTTIRDRDVIVQDDGPYFAIYNTSGRSLSFEVKPVPDDHEAWEPIELYGLSGAPVVGISPGIAPGRREIRCSHEEDWVAVDVVDPHDTFVSVRLECSDWTAFDVPWTSSWPKGLDVDPVDLARQELVGVLAADRIEPTGYGGRYIGWFRIVRRGHVVASVRYMQPNAGGWLMASGRICPGFGIAFDIRRVHTD